MGSGPGKEDGGSMGLFETFNPDLWGRVFMNGKATFWAAASQSDYNLPKKIKNLSQVTTIVPPASLP